MSDAPLPAAPLLSALEALAASRPLRMHMPGHKGITLNGITAAVDFTELAATGDLYRDGEGSPIRKAEAKWAEVFGVHHCLFLTVGSSQGICAALSALTRPGGKILLDRCYHTAFTHAMALLDLRPIYLERTLTANGLPAPIDAPALSDVLKSHPDIKTVCITSPTYYGTCSDVPSVAAVVHAAGARLFVDAAHGAHFPFAGLGSPASGADVFVCSAHKTLPALGQSALLFCKEDSLYTALRGATALFGTSSPSYLLMASLDAARAWMEAEGRRRLTGLEITISNLRGKYNNLLPSDDPFRLVADTAVWGYSGNEAAEIWRNEFNLWVEIFDNRLVTLISTACDDSRAIAVIDAAMARLRDGAKPFIISSNSPSFPQAAKRLLSPREAVFGPRRQLRLSQAGEMAAAADILVYPPGIPLCAAGEIIDVEALERAGVGGNTQVDVCI